MITIVNAFLGKVTDGGAISPKRDGDTVPIPFSQVARLASVHRNTLARMPNSPVVQARLGEVARIIAAAPDLLEGDTGRAIVWFRHQPLAGFDGRTAEELVTEGHPEAVIAHLEILRDGAYA